MARKNIPGSSQGTSPWKLFLNVPEVSWETSAGYAGHGRAEETLLGNELSKCRSVEKISHSEMMLPICHMFLFKCLGDDETHVAVCLSGNWDELVRREVLFILIHSIDFASENRVVGSQQNSHLKEKKTKQNLKRSEKKKVQPVINGGNFLESFVVRSLLICGKARISDYLQQTFILSSDLNIIHFIILLFPSPNLCEIFFPCLDHFLGNALLHFKLHLHYSARVHKWL